ncbi:MAG: EAL domain-containing protein [Gammaproteobacteria bacterium]|nr:EAL domain-containing protein [Gammaproteobacteria bacterium]
MTLDKNTHLLTGILIVVMFSLIGVTTFQNYKTALDEEFEHLTETVKSQARLIESIARFDQKFSTYDMFGSPEAATLSQIRDAHGHFRGLHSTGEFTLAKLDQGYIRYLLERRNKPPTSRSLPPREIKMGSEFAVPMQFALSGKSGTVIAKDYRGVEVLAAYEPVAVLGYGIVAKIDLEEVRQPFVNAGLWSLLIGTVLIVFAALGFGLVTRPLIDRVYKSEETYRLVMEATQDGIWDWDIEHDTAHYSSGWGKILGNESVPAQEINWKSRVHVDDLKRVLRSLKLHLAGRSDDWQEEHRIQRYDGSWSWVLAQGKVVSRDDSGNALRMLGTIADINFKKENEEVIWQQANYDTLTLLPNRKLFHELLIQKIKQARRSKQELWLLFLDLDGFKEINDTLGHHKGDELLVMVSERLKSSLRQADIVARLGGDEFVILLSDISESVYVDRVSDKLVDVIGQTYELHHDHVAITTSIGIAKYPNDAGNADDLIKYADQSMYAAKREGKNRYCYFTPELQKESQIRLQIATDLRKGLSNDEFELYFQPIVDFNTGQIHKAEALIRWNHPGRGLISPADFIPIAEESGVIQEIGAWVFDSVFRQLMRWQSYVNFRLKISVNVSPFQLLNSNPKYDKWLDDIHEYGISGENIVIEITEGLLLKKDRTVIDKLLQCRDAGVQVAIDDFGTGYSSLAYLREFDIDYLKIDQSFVRNLGPETNEQILSEAIIVMAQKLGLQVIAEGVETAQQRDILTTMGCDYGQGYLFAKPMPAEQFENDFLKPHLAGNIEPLFVNRMIR